MMMENLVKAVEARIAEYRAKADAARAAYYQRIRVLRDSQQRR